MQGLVNLMSALQIYLVKFDDSFLCLRIERSGGGGHIVLPLSVCLSVRPSVCLHKLNVKTEHFPITPKLIYLQGSYLVWRHISSICICWYQGQGHLQRSRSNIKVTFLKKWPFRGHSCFTNTSCFLLPSCKQSHKV